MALFDFFNRNSEKKDFDEVFDEVVETLSNSMIFGLISIAFAFILMRVLPDSYIALIIIPLTVGIVCFFNGFEEKLKEAIENFHDFELSPLTGWLIFGLAMLLIFGGLAAYAYFN